MKVTRRTLTAILCGITILCVAATAGAKTGIGSMSYTLNMGPGLGTECAWFQATDEGGIDLDQGLACLGAVPVPISMISEFFEFNSWRFDGDTDGCQFEDAGPLGDGYWHHEGGTYFVRYRSYDISGSLGLTTILDVVGTTFIPFDLEITVFVVKPYVNYANIPGEFDCNFDYSTNKQAGQEAAVGAKNKWGEVASTSSTATLGLALVPGQVGVSFLASISSTGIGSGGGDAITCHANFVGTGQATVIVAGRSAARLGTLSSNGACTSTTQSIQEELNELFD